MPSALQYIACPIADNTSTVLRISCPDPGIVEIVDKTALGRNSTRVSSDGVETERLTRGRKKPFMLSGEATEDKSVLHCRLVSRGPGWHTRQERFLSDDGERLVERHVLVRPEQEDVVVTRQFVRAPGNDEDLRPATSST